MSDVVRGVHLTSQGDSFAVGAASSYTQLWGINVNTGAAGALVNLWQSNPSTATSKLAKLDASSKSQNVFNGIRMKDGMFVSLDGNPSFAGSISVTVSYS